MSNLFNLEDNKYGVQGGGFSLGWNVRNLYEYGSCFSLGCNVSSMGFKVVVSGGVRM